MNDDEQLVNEPQRGTDPDTIDLTMDDEPDEVIQPVFPRENGLAPYQNGVQVVNMVVGGRQEENGDDDLMIDEQPQIVHNGIRNVRSAKLIELLSWFKKLKAEHIIEFKTGGDHYLTEYVGDAPFLPMEQCTLIANDYKERGSLSGLAEKWELSSDELLIAAICIGVLENNNSIDVNFAALGDSRIDEWSIEKMEMYFHQTATEPNEFSSPLKFMQFTVTTPAAALVLLTYFHMKTNNFPCQFVPDDCLMETVGDVDIKQMTANIVDASARYWGERKESDNQNYHANMNKELKDFFHEIEATSAEMKDHFDKTLGKRSEVLKLVRNKVPHFVAEEFDEELLSQELRRELVRTKGAMDLLRAESQKFVAEARKVYRKKSSTEQMHVLKPGDFCLARTVNKDTFDLKYARVDKVLSAERYQVKFLNSDKLAECHIRDMALTNHGLCHPLYNITGYVGLRVAVFVPRTAEFQQKWQWESGTTGGRRSSNKGDFLVFLDDGSDAYVPAPCIPGDPGYDQVVAKPEGVPVTFQDILTRMKAARIAVMVGQPIGSSGVIEKRFSHYWVRDKHRAAYIKHYMNVYPEFWLLKMSIGMVTYLNSVPPDNRCRQRVTVVGLDRSFAIVRPQAAPNMLGANCLDYPCPNKSHVHGDMSIYRGSARLEEGSLNRREKMMLTSNNNLSRRRRDQIAQNFELSETSRVMPQRVNAQQFINTRVAGPKPPVVPEEKQKTAAEIAEKKKNQRLFTKTVVKVPQMPPKGGTGPHTLCGPDCLLKMDANPYDERFHHNSPLHTPILCGWRRLKYTTHNGKKRSAFKKSIVYIAPCGKPLEKMEEITGYLRDTRSQLAIDCFTFDSMIDTETYVTVDDKYVRMPDLSQGIEGIPIPLVNSVDNDPNPKLEYCKRRFPYNQTVDISSISQDFCSGCSCDGDCSQNENCECQLLSKQSAERLPHYLQYENRKKLGSMYSNRMLPNKVITGIYECNDKCKCKRDACHNRVVQNNIKYPVHIFKTAESGWGCRALTDIPDGTFVCTYVGALLTNDLADEFKNDDQYFADLDLKDGVEMLKGQEDNDTDLGYGGDDSNDEDFSDPDADYEKDDANDKEVKHRAGPSSSSQRPARVTRRASQEEKVKDARLDVEPKKEQKDEPVFNWEIYFDKSALFVVDAKVRGNIGRFLNHSCDPNCIVQHVMYDTHDLRLPWVAFFTIKHIKAGQELTWDYQYTLPSNTGPTRLKCKCEAAQCRTRLL